MADFSFDTRAIDRFKRDLDDLQEHFPKEAKQLMRRTGNKARMIVAKKGRQLVKRRTGTYLKGIKRGKVWQDGDGIKVRVYNSAPHAHLIEYGHRMVGHKPDKKELGFVQGAHVFDRASREIEQEWDSIIDVEFEKILRKL